MTIRVLAARILVAAVAMGPDELRTGLLEAARVEPDPTVLGEEIDALITIQTPEVNALRLEHLENPSDYVRSRAANGLKRAAATDEAVVSALASALDRDPSPRVRSVICGVLENAESPAALGARARHAGADEAETVRSACARTKP